MKVPSVARAAPWAMPVLLPLCLGLVGLLVRQGLCDAYRVPAYLLPKPTDIAASLSADPAALLGALLSTMRVTLLAFALSVANGMLSAFLLVQSRLSEMSLLPCAVLLQVTPIVAVAPLIIILCHDTMVALVICATVVAIFPVISNTTIGPRRVDPGLAAYFRMNKATRLQIPSALPMILAGLRISSGLASVGAVVAEFVAGPVGVAPALRTRSCRPASSSISRACSRPCS